ncbi:hypothetical protein [Ornithinimicrobium cerasi]|uniref:DUF4268 domain-containing protein n=1 Tax=Ornithinimicrobium cerasi TaxID=2248773 RepID=A0A285VHX8_9MICO|nr:hypothetical protein [Ornithinimicrobium cerasi]SOC53714.1 hypothetical protein SAMN05421879_10281 [Ornithinimicrobium cerasi]
MAHMGRLSFGRLSQAWTGEAADFTPLLVDRLDQLGDALGLDLLSAGQSEVSTAGGRRIDIVAQGSDGSEFVIENQYGRADHDHLTRGLAYAVAREARGLILVAEEHRDEFRAVAQYLNEMRELAPERGIAVWLVEARAVRVDTSPWAPLFTAVVQPNEFTAVVERAKQDERPSTLSQLWEQFTSPETLEAAREILGRWEAAGHKRRLGPNHVVLEARGPAVSGIRTVVAIYTDGRVMVPFSSYAGQNSGVTVPALTTVEFRSRADALFGFSGSERQARTAPGWLTRAGVEPLWSFSTSVAAAYSDVLDGEGAAPVVPNDPQDLAE